MAPREGERPVKPPLGFVPDYLDGEMDENGQPLFTRQEAERQIAALRASVPAAPSSGGEPEAWGEVRMLLGRADSIGWDSTGLFSVNTTMGDARRLDALLSPLLEEDAALRARSGGGAPPMRRAVLPDLCPDDGGAP